MRALLRLAALVALVFVAVSLAQRVDLGSRVRAEGALQKAKGKIESAVPDVDVDAIARELKETGRVVRRHRRVKLRDNGSSDAGSERLHGRGVLALVPGSLS